MAREFYPGALVECIDDRLSEGLLVQGRRYRVWAVTSGKGTDALGRRPGIGLFLDDVRCGQPFGFSALRFRIAEPPSLDPFYALLNREAVREAV